MTDEEVVERLAGDIHRDPEWVRDVMTVVRATVRNDQERALAAQARATSQRRWR